MTNDSYCSRARTACNVVHQAHGRHKWPINRSRLNISFVAMDGLDPRVTGVKEFCLNVEKFYVIQKGSDKDLGIHEGSHRSLAGQDFSSFMQSEAVEWKHLEDLSTPEECMYNWLQECVLNPFHVDRMTVQCWESTYYLILDAACDLEHKYAAVKVFDVYDGDNKIFCFK